MAFSIGGVGSTNRNLGASTRRLSDLFQQLSSGSRLAGKTSNDPAGAAIFTALQADAAVSRVARDNSVGGQLVSQVAESTLQSGADVTIRLRELAAQAANGTLSDAQRISLNEEASALRAEQNRQIATAEFNGSSVFGSKTYQVGNDSSSNSQITSPSTDPSSIIASEIDLSTQESALAALDQLAAEGESSAQLIGAIGATTSRLQVAESAAESSELTAREAAARIGDLDIADAVTKLNQERGLQEFATRSQQQALKASGAVINRLLTA
jgi:flagellin